MPFAAPVGVLAGLVGAVIIFVGLKTEWAKAEGGNAFETTAAQIGNALLDPYVIPFEVASVLLVVAMLGAILLVRPANGGEAE
jgi:NAD(P)H-quinone oxidoreductase subunit 6